MTRILTFDGPRAPRRYELLWTSLISGGDGKDRTPLMIRKEARLQDTFERLGQAGKLTPENGTKMELPQEDFDLLQQYTEKTVWNPAFSRDVVDLWDFLSSCPKED